MSDLPEGMPTPTIMSGVEKGWWPLVLECHRRLVVLHPSYTVNQVKEKFGTLRYYFSAEDVPVETFEAMSKVVGEIEARSAAICEICGQPGRVREDGWLKTLCDEDAERWEGGWRPWHEVSDDQAS